MKLADLDTQAYEACEGALVLCEALALMLPKLGRRPMRMEDLQVIRDHLAIIVPKLDAVVNRNPKEEV